MRALFVISALILTACSPNAPEKITEALESPPKPEIAAPKLGVMHDPNSEAFCAFFPEGHKFVYGDLDTWKFVFTSPLENTVGDGMAMIDGKVRNFKNISVRKTATGEIRHLKTITAPFVDIEVTMIESKDSPAESEYSESTAYTGTVRVIAPATGAPAKFWGDCGV